MNSSSLTHQCLHKACAFTLLRSHTDALLSQVKRRNSVHQQCPAVQPCGSAMRGTSSIQHAATAFAGPVSMLLINTWCSCHLQAMIAEAAQANAAAPTLQEVLSAAALVSGHALQQLHQWGVARQQRPFHPTSSPEGPALQVGSDHAPRNLQLHII